MLKLILVKYVFSCSSSDILYQTDAVQANGELVSRLEQHATADAVGSEKPHLHAQAQLDVPSEGVHRVLVQDGAHVSVHDATTIAPSEEVTTKVSGTAKNKPLLHS